MRLNLFRTARRSIGGVVIALALAGSAGAQALFDEAALVAACSDAGCAAEVEAIVTDLGDRSLPTPEFNSQIGFLAAILLQSAATAEAATLPYLADGLGVLGNATTDARQSASIAQVAEAVGQGQAGALSASTAYAASPSRPFNWRDRRPTPFRSGPGPGRNRSRWSDFWQR